MRIWDRLFSRRSSGSDSTDLQPQQPENQHPLPGLLAPDLEATLKGLGGEDLLERARSNDAKALYKVGEMYFRGHDSVSRNLALAGRCFRLSAEGGNEDAYGALCNCALKSEEALDELIDYCGSYTNERDRILKLLDMEEDETQHIRTACGTCVHLAYPHLFTTGQPTVTYGTCHHYDDGRGSPRRTIVVPPAEQMDVFCPSWRSERLLTMIFLHGIHPGDIGGGVRRPRLTAPPGGLERLRARVS